ncbi:hypothetical protein SAMD00023353_4800520 [Rosellinia necatrix]|uniref:Protein kinase domain-containing protein n=1 Tax=Rosellinia necatrix TaxID=77044 RepID=A0A1S8A9Q6_ROSNE|nr:hypothetical protein SAMD00023353_4800520 [Rosellinia necatrix]
MPPLSLIRGKFFSEDDHIAGLNTFRLQRQTQDPDLEARIRETAEYFDSLPFYAFDSVIGRGAYGFTICVVERRFGSPPRKLVVKRALYDSAMLELREEIQTITVCGRVVSVARGEKEIDVLYWLVGCGVVR